MDIREIIEIHSPILKSIMAIFNEVDDKEEEEWLHEHQHNAAKIAEHEIS